MSYIDHNTQSRIDIFSEEVLEIGPAASEGKQQGANTVKVCSDASREFIRTVVLDSTAKFTKGDHSLLPNGFNPISGVDYHFRITK